jgi:hypothetical protein
MDGPREKKAIFQGISALKSDFANFKVFKAIHMLKSVFTNFKVFN